MASAVTKFRTIADLPWENLGEGWQQAVVDLQALEAAPNPASTNRPYVFGPARVTYQRGPSGAITAYVEDLPS